jgi:hypothetical protein
MPAKGRRNHTATLGSQLAVLAELQTVWKLFHVVLESRFLGAPSPALHANEQHKRLFHILRHHDVKIRSLRHVDLCVEGPYTDAVYFGVTRADSSKSALEPLMVYWSAVNAS